MEQGDAAVPAPPPLSRAACVVLVRIVLGGDEETRPAGLAGEFLGRCGDDPAVASWLATIERSLGDVAAAREAVAARLVDGFEVSGASSVAESPEEGALAAAAAAALAARSERRGLESAVAAARLEALREFAYGAGHEINNPLANIATRAQSLLLEESSPERRRRLAAIVDQAFRGRDMIGGLMVFARPPKPVPAALDAATMLGTVVEAVRPLATARGARLDCSPPPAPVDVFVDPGHVGEALRLVAVNALEAVASGGRVTLEARRLPGGGTAPRCEVIVADDGPGMDADTLRRAFDPFFSGREAGRGIGMGLPKAWRLVETNGGSIAVESGPGRGTRVSMLLPLADARP